jgi:hypothetical protein
VETNEKGARKTGRSRYWSVMLVGDHGRVIPFRHFKALIVGVGVVLVLSLCALILLGVLYTGQRGQIVHLQAQVEQLRTQSTKIRDEKDLYLTELIALQKQTGTLPQKPADAPEAIAEDGPPPADVKVPPASEKAAPEPETAAPQTEEVKKEGPVQKPEPPVHWSADIRRFNVSYDNRQGAVTAEFRIYNTSRPKKRLKGRTVVVFKAIGDPPSQWAIVPAVPLDKEIPLGNQGRPFNIRNYQTERFKTLRRNNSPRYEIAAVYIFADPGGELIGNKELPFNVDYSPPAPPKPVVAPPKPAVESPKPVVTPPETESVKPSAPTQAPQSGNPSSGMTTPGDAKTQDTAPGKTEPTSTVFPPDAPSGPSNTKTPPDQAPTNSQVDTDGDGIQEPGTSDVAAPAPPSDTTRPAQEGETK